MYQECGAYQLCSLCALSRGVRTFALGGARGPPGAEAEAACACRPRARSGAGIAAQAAVRPTRVRVGHVVEHVAARAAGCPAGAADRSGPGRQRMAVDVPPMRAREALTARGRTARSRAWLPHAGSLCTPPLRGSTTCTLLAGPRALRGASRCRYSLLPGVPRRSVRARLHRRAVTCRALASNPVYI